MASPVPRSPRALSNGVVAVLLLLPGLGLLGLVSVYPLVASFITSLSNESLVYPGRTFAGWANYAAVLDSGFVDTIWTTLVFTTGATLVPFVVGLALALLLDMRVPGRNTLRGLMLLPWVIPGVVVSFLWSWIFNSNYGLLNELLGALGLPSDHSWTGDVSTAMLTVIIAKTWTTFPWVMVTLLAALKSVPVEMLEAAQIDGATRWQRIWRVKLPQVRGVMLVVAMLEIIYNFQHFDIIYVLTGGGPGKATSTLAIRIYDEAFRGFDLGRAAALGFCGLVLLAALFTVYRWLDRRVEGQNA
ncbi:carbohydrate ABC transporter membrane protein 1, CUT1 family [Micromonospora coxensis]|uniref:Carbohydrate ABC transporter membrane protein 1, CUT1 family n=1 Tax=Micromonospora coxensis TaxID=356852 RepID=A0A1C5K1M6_9ACTN|nr:carbohydrate ABC transporter membrane protein 1, CUT1 family [Micromonospora coxensis]